MGWVTAFLAIVEALPGFITLIKNVVAAVKGHPAGPVAGVAAVQAHMANFPTAGLVDTSDTNKGA
jgi:hypothetical protein